QILDPLSPAPGDRPRLRLRELSVSSWQTINVPCLPLIASHLYESVALSCYFWCYFAIRLQAKIRLQPPEFWVCRVVGQEEAPCPCAASDPARSPLLPVEHAHD